MTPDFRSLRTGRGYLCRKPGNPRYCVHSARPSAFRPQATQAASHPDCCLGINPQSNGGKPSLSPKSTCLKVVDTFRFTRCLFRTIHRPSPIGNHAAMPVTPPRSVTQISIISGGINHCESFQGYADRFRSDCTQRQPLWVIANRAPCPSSRPSQCGCRYGVRFVMQVLIFPVLDYTPPLSQNLKNRAFCLQSSRICRSFALRRLLRAGPVKEALEAVGRLSIRFHIRVIQLRVERAKAGRDDGRRERSTGTGFTAHVSEGQLDMVRGDTVVSLNFVKIYLEGLAMLSRHRSRRVALVDAFAR